MQTHRWQSNMPSHVDSIDNISFELGTCELAVYVRIEYESNRTLQFEISNWNRTLHRIGRTYRLTRARMVWRLWFIFHLFSLCTAIVQTYRIRKKEKRCAELLDSLFQSSNKLNNSNVKLVSLYALPLSTANGFSRLTTTSNGPAHPIQKFSNRPTTFESNRMANSNRILKLRKSLLWMTDNEHWIIHRTEQPSGSPGLSCCPPVQWWYLGSPASVVLISSSGLEQMTPSNTYPSQRDMLVLQRLPNLNWKFKLLFRANQTETTVVFIIYMIGWHV